MAKKLFHLFNIARYCLLYETNYHFGWNRLPVVANAFPIPKKPPYTLAMVLDELNKRKQDLIDIEQSPFSPEFDHLTLDDKDSFPSLEKLLSTRGYAYERHGSVMLIYDKKLRLQSPDQYPLANIDKPRMTE